MDIKVYIETQTFRHSDHNQRNRNDENIHENNVVLVCVTKCKYQHLADCLSSISTYSVGSTGPSEIVNLIINAMYRVKPATDLTLAIISTRFLEFDMQKCVPDVTTKCCRGYKKMSSSYDLVISVKLTHHDTTIEGILPTPSRELLSEIMKQSLCARRSE